MAAIVFFLLTTQFSIGAIWLSRISRREFLREMDAALASKKMARFLPNKNFVIVVPNPRRIQPKVDR